MHGYDQSQALTVAAQNLSEAKANYHHAEVMTLLASKGTDSQRTEHANRLETARHNLGVAKTVYRAAYKAYTNPFGIEKTS